MIITRTTFGAMLNKRLQGLLAVVAAEGEKVPQDWREIYSTRPSSGPYETTGYYTGSGYPVEKPEGAPFSIDQMIQGYTKNWVHTTFGLGLQISMEAKQDNDINLMSAAARALGRSLVEGQNHLAYRLLMNASATTYHTAGDGLAIASNSHVLLGGGTYDNLGDAADPSENALEAAIKNFELIPHDRGFPVDRDPRVLHCGKKTEFEWVRILYSDFRPGTDWNDVNAVKKSRSIKLKVHKHITDRRWFLTGKKDKDCGLVHFDRMKPTTSTHGVWETGGTAMVGYFRDSNEVNDARNIYMVPEL